MHGTALTTPLMWPELQPRESCGWIQNFQNQSSCWCHPLANADDEKHESSAPEGYEHSADSASAAGSHYRLGEREVSTRMATLDWLSVSDLTSSYGLPRQALTGIFWVVNKSEIKQQQAQLRYLNISLCYTWTLNLTINIQLPVSGKKFVLLKGS